MRPDPYKQKKSLQYQKKNSSSKQSASENPTKITKAGQNTTNSTYNHNKPPSLESPANYKKDDTTDSLSNKKSAPKLKTVAPISIKKLDVSSLVPNLNNKLKQTRIKNGIDVAETHLNKNNSFPGLSTKESSNFAPSNVQSFPFENSFSDKNNNSQMLNSNINSSESKESDSGRDSLDELEDWLDDVL
ncbi:hypothetical protein AYI69_g2657 [Smittium culicis]|uniref:Uncharacterized protein n=1 Tax=Smittium culicis TaxID=133412 RepID=A0A1R1YLT5_9FUNG|nr:hypothetical protein AYI69_g2657 [Smittium culicis]